MFEEERDVGWRDGLAWICLKLCSKMFKEPRPVFISFAIRSATPIALIRRGCVMMMFASEGLRMKQPHYILNAQHFYAFCADLIIFYEWSCWCDVERPSSCTSMTLGKPILKNEPHKKKKNTWSEQNVGKSMKRTTTKRIKVITSEKAWCFSLMRISKCILGYSWHVWKHWNRFRKIVVPSSMISMFIVGATKKSTRSFFRCEHSKAAKSTTNLQRKFFTFTDDFSDTSWPCTFAGQVIFHSQDTAELV